MAGNIVKCGSCGKQYRVPEGFGADELECKACGEMIPLAEPERPRRRGRREPPPPKSKLPLILGGVGVVVVIVLLVVVVGGGNGGASETPANIEANAVDEGPKKPVVPVEPVPEIVDYGDADKTARIEIGELYKLKPTKPRVKSKGGGIVSNEDWARYQKQLITYDAKRKDMYTQIAEKGRALVKQFPGSKYEMETAEKAVLPALYHSEQYEDLITVAAEYEAKFGRRIAMASHRWTGDALEKLERFEEAAAAYGKYVETAKRSVLWKAAVKQVHALMKAGKAEEAQSTGAALSKRVAMAEPRINAILRPLSMLAKPLPKTPGAKLLLSEDDVDWASYKGKPLLVIIWSTQYAECDEPIARASKLLGTVEDLQVVGVVLEEKSTDSQIDSWLRGHDIQDFPQVVQRGRFSQSKLLQKWGLAWEDTHVKPPLLIVADKRGVVRYVGVPAGDHLAKLIRGMK